LYLKKCVSKGDYQLTKGIRGEIKIPVHKLFGLRKFDQIQTPKELDLLKEREQKELSLWKI